MLSCERLNLHQEPLLLVKVSDGCATLWLSSRDKRLLTCGRWPWTQMDGRPPRWTGVTGEESLRQQRSRAIH